MANSEEVRAKASSEDSPENSTNNIFKSYRPLRESYTRLQKQKAGSRKPEIIHLEVGPAESLRRQNESDNNSRVVKKDGRRKCPSSGAKDGEGCKGQNESSEDTVRPVGSENEKSKSSTKARECKTTLHPMVTRWVFGGKKKHGKTSEPVGDCSQAKKVRQNVVSKEVVGSAKRHFRDGVAAKADTKHRDENGKQEIKQIPRRKSVSPETVSKISDSIRDFKVKVNNSDRDIGEEEPIKKLNNTETTVPEKALKLSPSSKKQVQDKRLERYIEICSADKSTDTDNASNSSQKHASYGMVPKDKIGTMKDSKSGHNLKASKRGSSEDSSPQKRMKLEKTVSDCKGEAFKKKAKVASSSSSSDDSSEASTSSKIKIKISHNKLHQKSKFTYSNSATKTSVVTSNVPQLTSALLVSSEKRDKKGTTAPQKLGAKYKSCTASREKHHILPSPKNVKNAQLSNKKPETNVVREKENRSSSPLPETLAKHGSYDSSRTTPSKEIATYKSPRKNDSTLEKLTICGKQRDPMARSKRSDFKSRPLKHCPQDNSVSSSSENRHLPLDDRTTLRNGTPPPAGHVVPAVYTVGNCQRESPEGFQQGNSASNLNLKSKEKSKDCVTKKKCHQKALQKQHETQKEGSSKRDKKQSGKKERETLKRKPERDQNPQDGGSPTRKRISPPMPGLLTISDTKSREDAVKGEVQPPAQKSDCPSSKTSEQPPSFKPEEQRAKEDEFGGVLEVILDAELLRNKTGLPNHNWLQKRIGDNYDSFLGAVTSGEGGKNDGDKKVQNLRDGAKDSTRDKNMPLLGKYGEEPPRIGDGCAPDSKHIPAKQSSRNSECISESDDDDVQVIDYCPEVQEVEKIRDETRRSENSEKSKEVEETRASSSPNEENDCVIVSEKVVLTRTPVLEVSILLRLVDRESDTPSHCKGKTQKNDLSQQTGTEELICAEVEAQTNEDLIKKQQVEEPKRQEEQKPDRTKTKDSTRQEERQESTEPLANQRSSIPATSDPNRSEDLTQPSCSKTNMRTYENLEDFLAEIRALGSRPFEDSTPGEHSVSTDPLTHRPSLLVESSNRLFQKMKPSERLSTYFTWTKLLVATFVRSGMDERGPQDQRDCNESESTTQLATTGNEVLKDEEPFSDSVENESSKERPVACGQDADCTPEGSTVSSSKPVLNPGTTEKGDKNGNFEVCQTDPQLSITKINNDEPNVLDDITGVVNALKQELTTRNGIANGQENMLQVSKTSIVGSITPGAEVERSEESEQCTNRLGSALLCLPSAVAVDSAANMKKQVSSFSNTSTIKGKSVDDINFGSEVKQKGTAILKTVASDTAPDTEKTLCSNNQKEYRQVKLANSENIPPTITSLSETNGIEIEPKLREFDKGTISSCSRSENGPSKCGEETKEIRRTDECSIKVKYANGNSTEVQESVSKLSSIIQDLPVALTEKNKATVTDVDAGATESRPFNTPLEQNLIKDRAVKLPDSNVKSLEGGGIDSPRSNLPLNVNGTENLREMPLDALSKLTDGKAAAREEVDNILRGSDDMVILLRETEDVEQQNYQQDNHGPVDFDEAPKCANTSFVGSDMNCEQPLPSVIKESDAELNDNMKNADHRLICRIDKRKIDEEKFKNLIERQQAELIGNNPKHVDQKTVDGKASVLPNKPERITKEGTSTSEECTNNQLQKKGEGKQTNCSSQRTSVPKCNDCIDDLTEDEKKDSRPVASNHFEKETNSEFPENNPNGTITLDVTQEHTSRTHSSSSTSNQQGILPLKNDSTQKNSNIEQTLNLSSIINENPLVFAMATNDQERYEIEFNDHPPCLKNHKEVRDAKEKPSKLNNVGKNREILSNQPEILKSVRQNASLSEPNVSEGKDCEQCSQNGRVRQVDGLKERCPKIALKKKRGIWGVDARDNDNRCLENEGEDSNEQHSHENTSAVDPSQKDFLKEVYHIKERVQKLSTKQQESDMHLHRAIEPNGGELNKLTEETDHQTNIKVLNCRASTQGMDVALRKGCNSSLHKVSEAIIKIPITLSSLASLSSDMPDLTDSSNGTGGDITAITERQPICNQPEDSIQQPQDNPVASDENELNTKQNSTCKRPIISYLQLQKDIPLISSQVQYVDTYSQAYGQQENLESASTRTNSRIEQELVTNSALERLINFSSKKLTSVNNDTNHSQKDASIRDQRSGCSQEVLLTQVTSLTSEKVDKGRNTSDQNSYLPQTKQTQKSSHLLCDLFDSRQAQILSARAFTRKAKGNVQHSDSSKETKRRNTASRNKSKSAAKGTSKAKQILNSSSLLSVSSITQSQERDTDRMPQTAGINKTVAGNNTEDLQPSETSDTLHRIVCPQPSNQMLSPRVSHSEIMHGNKQGSSTGAKYPSLAETNQSMNSGELTIGRAPNTEIPPSHIFPGMQSNSELLGKSRPSNMPQHQTNAPQHQAVFPNAIARNSQCSGRDVIKDKSTGFVRPTNLSKNVQAVSNSEASQPNFALTGAFREGNNTSNTATSLNPVSSANSSLLQLQNAIVQQQNENLILNRHNRIMQPFLSTVRSQEQSRVTAAPNSNFQTRESIIPQQFLPHQFPTAHCSLGETRFPMRSGKYAPYRQHSMHPWYAMQSTQNYPQVQWPLQQYPPYQQYGPNFPMLQSVLLRQARPPFDTAYFCGNNSVQGHFRYTPNELPGNSMVNNFTMEPWNAWLEHSNLPQRPRSSAPPPTVPRGRGTRNTIGF